MSKYTKTKIPGIRVNEKGDYNVTKSINGKRYYKNFSNLRDAKYWKQNFHPILNSSPTQSNPIVRNKGFKNGVNDKITLQDMFDKYKAQALFLLSDETQYKKDLCITNFIKGFEDLRLSQLTPEVIGDILTEKKKTALLNPQRTSFERDLKELSSVFNWYIEAIDFYFINPIKGIVD